MKGGNGKGKGWERDNRRIVVGKGEHLRYMLQLHFL